MPRLPHHGHGIEAQTVIREANENGISKRTLYRAKDELGIRPRKTAVRGPWTWELPEAGQGVRSESLATFDSVGHLGLRGPEDGVLSDLGRSPDDEGGQPGGEGAFADELARLATSGEIVEPALFDGAEEVERWH